MSACQPGARTVAIQATEQAGKQPRAVACGRDEDQVAEETAVAFIYNGISQVVMMATPLDLEDFALGFSLSEGILADPGQLYSLEQVSHRRGLELRMEVATEAFNKLKQRRRNLAGRSGCGLCGAESLEQALPEPQRVSADLRVPAAALTHAVRSLADRQPLKALTGSVHGAAWCNAAGDILRVREDVGRHNALDKLIGSLVRQPTGEDGFVLITSRASYEMVAKTAAADIPMLAAVSAPTSLAIEQAEASGLTLVAHLSACRQVVYAGGQRIQSERGLSERGQADGQ